ncbi:MULTISPECIES: acyltransferase domain-containing protein [Streptomyces]|nr:MULTISPECIES: acyltransferase domain-containing protein [Streptomyces]MCH0558527.1 acyltransferase domain-containing protein [Streptomyces sp. MUM 16J]
MSPDGRIGRTVFLFPASASPHPGTGWELLAAFPVFTEALDAICARLDPYLELPLKSVLCLADRAQRPALVERVSFSGPAVFALQAAQYRLLQSWGLQPDVLFGHAAGRMGAAFAAGVFSLAEACHAVGTLARLLSSLPDTEPGSPHLDHALKAYGRTLATLHPQPPRLPLVSDVTARPVGAETRDPEFWIPRSPVRVADAVELLHQQGVRTWLELGPGDLLTRVLPRCPPDGPVTAFAMARDWPLLQAGPL